MSLPATKPYRFYQLGLLIVVIGLTLVTWLNWQPIVSHIIEWQQVLHALLAKNINAVAQNPLSHGLTLIALSFGYGVFHAIGPGHGKAVIITYLGSHKESLQRGAVIALLAAILQSLVAILLVAVLAKLLSIRFAEVNAYADDMTQVSYLLVMALGLFLLVTALVRQFRHHYLSSDPEHFHTHHCCGHQHVHQSSPSWLQSGGVILSMGIRPCSGAILVLIYAHLVDVFYYGVIATLVMGLGTGIAVASIALGTQLARNWFELFAKSDSNQKRLYNSNTEFYFRMIGGLIIFFVGLSLFQAATKISAGHPLI